MRYFQNNMKSLRFLFLLSIITVIGCSGIQVSQDYKIGTDFRTLKTFNWTSENQVKTGDARTDSTLINDRIRMAAEKELLTKGLVKMTESTPDFNISYHYTISKKIHSRPVSIATGYGRNYHRDYHRSPGLVTGTEVVDYDEVLLIIDFLKPGTEIILWRGISTQMYEPHTSPERANQNIDQTIHKILSQFPPLY